MWRFVVEEAGRSKLQALPRWMHRTQTLQPWRLSGNFVLRWTLSKSTSSSLAARRQCLNWLPYSAKHKHLFLGF